MCASVCPSQALYFGTREEIEKLRPRSRPVNEFKFGNQQINTKVYMMVPREEHGQFVDVTGAMHETAIGRQMSSEWVILEDVMDFMLEEDRAV